MSPTRGSVIGDFLRAVFALGAEENPELRDTVAQHFGLSVRMKESAPRVSGRKPDKEPFPPPGPVNPQHVQPERPPILPAAMGNPIPVNVQTLNAVDEVRPAWLASASVLPQRLPRHVPAKMSLLEPRWTRSILAMALYTYGDAGEIDVDRIVEEVVTGRPLRSIPVRRAPTLARGVYAWIDGSPSMQLFVQDQTQIARQLRDVVGSLGLNLRQTSGVPARSGEIAALVPHLVLSDLGLVENPDELSRDSPEAWAEWAEWIHRELGARVVALVPRRPSAYPKEIRRTFRLLHWDRGTSVQSIRRVLG